MNPEKFPVVSRNYQFKCTLCGNCCTGDQKVHLNLYDLYRMSRFHNYDNTKSLFDAGLIHLIKTDNGVFLPRIRFKVKPFCFCPFLINEEKQGICKLHPDHKPLICSMAPLGRVVDFENNSETYYLIEPAPDCPGMKSKVVNQLQDFKDEYATHLSYQERFFKLLEFLKDKNWSRSEFLELFYCFDCRLPFDEILDLIETNIYV